MKKLNLKSITVKKFKPHNNKDVKEPYKKLVSDITYIKTKENGWCYLATVMDLYNNEILWWSYSKKITKELTISALKKATKKINVVKNCILHSDLGSQYTNKEYIKIAKNLGFILSYSRKGNPYDNASIESFHAVLKKN